MDQLPILCPAYSLVTTKSTANTHKLREFYNQLNPKTTIYGLETLKNLGPKIWYILPDTIKQLFLQKQDKRLKTVNFS